MSGTGGRQPDGALHHRPFAEKKGPIERTPTEARQGEIILGKTGRWIWIVSFVLILVIALTLGFWR